MGVHSNGTLSIRAWKTSRRRRYPSFRIRRVLNILSSAARWWLAATLRWCPIRWNRGGASTRASPSCKECRCHYRVRSPLSLSAIWTPWIQFASAVVQRVQTLERGVGVTIGTLRRCPLGIPRVNQAPEKIRLAHLARGRNVPGGPSSFPPFTVVPCAPRATVSFALLHKNAWSAGRKFRPNTVKFHHAIVGKMFMFPATTIRSNAVFCPQFTGFALVPLRRYRAETCSKGGAVRPSLRARKRKLTGAAGGLQHSAGNLTVAWALVLSRLMLALLVKLADLGGAEISLVACHWRAKSRGKMTYPPPSPAKPD